MMVTYIIQLYRWIKIPVGFGDEQKFRFERGSFPLLVCGIEFQIRVFNLLPNSIDPVN